MNSSTTLAVVRPQTLQLAGRALHELVHFFVQFVPLFTFSLFTIHSTNTRAKEVEVKDFSQDTCCTGHGHAVGSQVGLKCPFLSLPPVNIHALLLK